DEQYFFPQEVNEPLMPGKINAELVVQDLFTVAIDKVVSDMSTRGTRFRCVACKIDDRTSDDLLGFPAPPRNLLELASVVVATGEVHSGINIGRIFTQDSLHSGDRFKKGRPIERSKPMQGRNT